MIFSLPLSSSVFRGFHFRQKVHSQCLDCHFFHKKWPKGHQSSFLNCILLHEIWILTRRQLLTSDRLYWTATTSTLTSAPLAAQERVYLLVCRKSENSPTNRKFINRTMFRLDRGRDEVPPAFFHCIQGNCHKCPCTALLTSSLSVRCLAISIHSSLQAHQLKCFSLMSNAMPSFDWRVCLRFRLAFLVMDPTVFMTKVLFAAGFQLEGSCADHVNFSPSDLSRINPSYLAWLSSTLPRRKLALILSKRHSRNDLTGLTTVLLAIRGYKSVSFSVLDAISFSMLRTRRVSERPFCTTSINFSTAKGLIRTSKSLLQSDIGCKINIRKLPACYL